MGLCMITLIFLRYTGRLMAGSGIEVLRGRLRKAALEMEVESQTVRDFRVQLIRFDIMSYPSPGECGLGQCSSALRKP